MEHTYIQKKNWHRVHFEGCCTCESLYRLFPKQQSISVDGVRNLRSDGKRYLRNVCTFSICSIIRALIRRIKVLFFKKKKRPIQCCMASRLTIQFRTSTQSSHKNRCKSLWDFRFWWLRVLEVTADTKACRFTELYSLRFCFRYHDQ